MTCVQTVNIMVTYVKQIIMSTVVLLSGIKSFTNIDPCLWQGQPLGFYILSLPKQVSKVVVVSHVHHPKSAS